MVLCYLRMGEWAGSNLRESLNINMTGFVGELGLLDFVDEWMNCLESFVRRPSFAFHGFAAAFFFAYFPPVDECVLHLGVDLNS